MTFSIETYAEGNSGSGDDGEYDGGTEFVRLREVVSADRNRFTDNECSEHRLCEYTTKPKNCLGVWQCAAIAFLN